MTERMRFFGEPSEGASPPVIMRFEDAIDVGEHIDKFFADVVNALGFDEKAAASFVRRDTNFIYTAGPDNIARPTDDRVTYLRAKGEIAAFVWEARDELNYTQAFFVNCLNDEISQKLKE